MKFKVIILILFAAFLLSACSSRERQSIVDNSSSANKVEYSTIFADYPFYEKPEGLIDAADLVLIGKVTSLSFQILDFKNGLPSTEKTKETDKILCTLYTVDVLTSYKGEVTKTITIRNQGGLKDEFLDEQLQVLRTISTNVIPIMDGMPQIRVGETYLFSLMEFEGTDPVLLNLDQSVIPIESTVVEDAYGVFSAKDIILCFGNEKWIDFEAKNYLEIEQMYMR